MNSDTDSGLGNNRLDGIQNILDGKFDIRQGIEDLCEALRDIRCRREYKAEINVVNGIRHIKEGLCQIKKGLRELRGQIDREDRREIKEGVRDICRGLKDLCQVLKDICCGCWCEAEKNLVRAIKQIEKGLCRIDKALDDIYLCA
jgi:uncharacterized coiled-coil DUF342 family protein